MADFASIGGYVLVGVAVLIFAYIMASLFPTPNYRVKEYSPGVFVVEHYADVGVFNRSWEWCVVNKRGEHYDPINTMRFGREDDKIFSAETPEEAESWIRRILQEKQDHEKRQKPINLVIR